MAWFIGQSLVIIVAAFLLGLAVGWLIWGRGWRRDRPAPAATASQAAERDVSVPAQREPAEAVAAEALTKPVAKTKPAAKTKTAAEAKPVAKAEPVAEAEPAPVVMVSKAEAEPVAEAKPAPVVAVSKEEPEHEPEEPDDLRRIEGIGPKISAALVSGGIRTYAQLAAADEAKLRAAIEAGGIRFAPSMMTWSQQARLLGDGDEDGFADLTQRLVAGRDTGR